MKKILCALSIATAAGAIPGVAFAEDNPLSYNVSLTSDYRYRGISQSRLQPALQGGADYAPASGLYVGTWLSTIKWIKDAGEIGGFDAGSANVEWDLYGGYKGEVQKDLSYDVGLLAYVYPGNNLNPSANTTEIYGALTFGPVTAKYSHSLTNLFGFVDSKNSGYLDLSASFDVGGGVSVTPHLGYQHVAKNSDFSYTDYSLTASKDFSGFVLSAALFGTSTKSIPANPGGYAYPSPDAKNLGRTGLVVAVKKTF
jgi:uncharacterized protein (TIGR02001 family)